MGLTYLWNWSENTQMTSHRLDLLVKDERAGDSNVHDREHLATNGVRGNLDGVRDEERGICDGVEAVEYKDGSHDQVGSAAVGWVVGVDTSTGGPENVGEEHASVGNQEQLATTNLLDEQRSRGGDDD